MSKKPDFNELLEMYSMQHLIFDEEDDYEDDCDDIVIGNIYDDNFIGTIEVEDFIDDEFEDNMDEDDIYFMLFPNDNEEDIEDILEDYIED